MPKSSISFHFQPRFCFFEAGFEGPWSCADRFAAGLGAAAFGGLGSAAAGFGAAGLAFGAFGADCAAEAVADPPALRLVAAAVAAAFVAAAAGALRLVAVVAAGAGLAAAAGVGAGPGVRLPKAANFGCVFW